MYIRIFIRRLSLLAYFNTLMLRDEPVIRPLFYEFQNVTAYDEFLLGDALLVCPIVKPNQTYTKVCFHFKRFSSPKLGFNDINVEIFFSSGVLNSFNPQILIYFPDIYYDFYFGFMMPKIGYSHLIVYESPLFIFIRSGFIVPTYQCWVSKNYQLLSFIWFTKPLFIFEDAKSAIECSTKPLTLIIAFKCTEVTEKVCSASGQFGTSVNDLWEFQADIEKVSYEILKFEFGKKIN